MESRQYPVTAHFNKTTPIEDYLEKTFEKVCQIHRKLPPGGILVFLTGKREIEWMVKKLESVFASADDVSGSAAAGEEAEDTSDEPTIEEQKDGAEVDVDRAAETPVGKAGEGKAAKAEHRVLTPEEMNPVSSAVSFKDLSAS